MLMEDSRTLCFVETWQQEHVLAFSISLHGFQMIQKRLQTDQQRWVRNSAVPVNNRCYPGHVTVKEHLCTPDVEAFPSLLSAKRD